MITKEKAWNLAHSFGDNSPSITLWCENCDDFVNDWGSHERDFPKHVTRSMNHDDILWEIVVGK